MKGYFFSLILLVSLFLSPIVFADRFEVLPVNNNKIIVFKNDELYLEIANSAWGKGWAWAGIKGTLEERERESVLVNSINIPKSSVGLSLLTKLLPSEDEHVTLNQELVSTGNTLIQMIATIIKPSESFFDKGKVFVELSNGTISEIDFPLKSKGLGNSELVQSFTLLDNDGGKTKFTLNPAVTISTKNEIRLPLAVNEVSQNEVNKLNTIITLPEPYTYYSGPSSAPDEPAFQNWYRFKTTSNHKQKSSIGMSDWLEKPAGKHGRIIRKDDKLIYNGKEIKLWGINLTYMNAVPKKKDSDQKADFYAKYGINGVRLHKFLQGPSWEGIQAPESVLEFDSGKLDRLDYFVSKLKEAGIFIELSLNFNLNPSEEDIQYIPYLNEFKNAFGLKNKRIKTKHGSIFLSKELQNLQIQQLVKFLNHKNPYTGLTYAQDPAITFVEMFNEDDALFYGTMKQITKIPTLRQRSGVMFSEWLEKKYGSKKALILAWGERALNSFKDEGFTDESWEESRIYPLGSPWYFLNEQLEGSQKYRKQRLLDTMRFLYELQNTFYSEFRDRIKQTGYDGELLSSNWFAGAGISNYYNLHTDYQFGTIDRHSYFGGGDNPILNKSMLRKPGSFILSSGMLQVVDRTFMLSEWITRKATEWSVEGPGIIGAYGMGLQGWDVSFMFQDKDGGKMNDHFVGKWQIDKPTIIGIFPAVSRQVLRGDVKESTLIIPRYVNMESLAEGYLDFNDSQVVEERTKLFSSDKVPSEALAIGRVVVEFTDEVKSTPTFDVDNHIHNGYFVSSTNQLKWKEGDSDVDGYFSIDSEGTKAVVGFARGIKNSLGKVMIESGSRFGAIYVTAINQDMTINTDSNLLITAIARVRQSGMKVYGDLYILEEGNAPFMMEPVKATISIQREGDIEPVVYLLNHDGVRTNETISIENGVINIDTGRDKTPYYEVVYVSEK